MPFRAWEGHGTLAFKLRLHQLYFMGGNTARHICLCAIIEALQVETRTPALSMVAHCPGMQADFALSYHILYVEPLNQCQKQV